MLEALWLHQHHNIVDEGLLERMLTSPEPLARAAATRVLCHWRDRVPNTFGLLNGLAADESPRVRLEAVRAASFLTVPEAVEVPLIAAEQPTDIYLDYIQGETMKALDRYWKEALASGTRVPFTSQAGSRFFLKNLSNDQLLKEERSRAVYIEMLYRPGLRDEHRHEAVEGLAKLDAKSELRVVIDAIRSLDATQSNAEPEVVFDRSFLSAPFGKSNPHDSFESFHWPATHGYGDLSQGVPYQRPP